MSISNELTRIQNAKADIVSAIVEKGGSVSAGALIDAFPSAIRAIPTGGGGDHDAEDGIIMRTISGAYENNRVTDIGIYAFYSCASLTTASFPACIDIGDYAFYNCTSLTTASFPACTDIGASAFYNCASLTTASFPACTDIGIYAFYNCTSLTTASFPACIDIGIYAFYSCASLTTASFPACRSIYSNAFRDCTSLTTASFPACTSIYSNAFRDCTSLTTASFPACRSIGSNVFASCRRLLSLYLTGGRLCTLSNSNAFNNTPIAGNIASTGGVYGSIFVPMSLLSTYQAATNWTYFSSRFVGVNPEDM